MKASETQIGGTHYKDMPIQPGVFIRKNGIGWYEGNAIKYICRYKQKGGIEDIKKAIHYLQLILEENETSVPDTFNISGFKYGTVDFSEVVNRNPSPVKTTFVGDTGNVPSLDSYLFNNVPNTVSTDARDT